MGIPVSVVDDNKKARDALGIIMKGTEGFEWCGSSSDCSNLLRDFNQAFPDVVLMENQMPDISGIEPVKERCSQFPETKTLTLTNFDEKDQVFSSICFGASGYLLKNTCPAKIIEAINEVYEGGASMTSAIAQQVLEMFRNHPPVHSVPEKDYHLTQREMEVLEFLVKGMSLKMTGETLLSVTIQYDLTSKIFTKSCVWFQ